MSTSSAAIATALIAGLLALAKNSSRASKRQSPSTSPASNSTPASIPPATASAPANLALADKLDAHQRNLLFAIERQGANFERRIDALESNLARLDERTRVYRQFAALDLLDSVKATLTHYRRSSL